MTLLGQEMGLPAEIKWQAITHKSFDHGRQPFNEKLAVFGMCPLST
jgi:large subunit ribosomal protein L15